MSPCDQEGPRALGPSLCQSVPRTRTPSRPLSTGLLSPLSLQHAPTCLPSRGCSGGGGPGARTHWGALATASLLLGFHAMPFGRHSHLN